MNTNVQITAVKMKFDGGVDGYQVCLTGLDGKLDTRREFHDSEKAISFLFEVAKKFDLEMKMLEFNGLSAAYERAKEEEQRIINEMAAVVADNDTEAEQAEEPANEIASTESVASVPTDSELVSSPMLKQFKDLKKQHPDAMLLFRCGDFYETYLEDAKAAAEILGITLTRNNKTGIEMAGFPYHALDSYLPKLIRAGKRVAICDQIENPKTTTKRGITELVSCNAESKPRGRRSKAEQPGGIQFEFNNEEIAV